ncbi:hypothetical protein ACWGJT_23515 [Streptomyces xantholiticus]
MEPKELEEIAPGRSRAVDIAGFVDLHDVPPVSFDPWGRRVLAWAGS